MIAFTSEVTVDSSLRDGQAKGQKPQHRRMLKDHRVGLTQIRNSNLEDKQRITTTQYASNDLLVSSVDEAPLLTGAFVKSQLNRKIMCETTIISPAVTSR